MKITWDMLSDKPDVDLHEYAFDVKLFAIVRVKAHSKAEAIEAMTKVIDGMEPDRHWIQGFNDASAVKLTEVSLDTGADAVLFEFDGEDV